MLLLPRVRALALVCLARRCMRNSGDMALRRHKLAAGGITRTTNARRAHNSGAWHPAAALHHIFGRHGDARAQAFHLTLAPV